jgi:pseudaminic acid biosynthesis-associated methylase
MAGEGEIQRLESLWSEDFGDSYVERNQAAAAGREPLWRWLYERHPFTSVLEVGCNVGGNLHWLQQLIAPEHVWGIDINAAALRQVRATMPDVNAVRSVARTLPFRDAQFELTFTTGVLIHQPPDSLPIVLNEIVRCSRRYVLCGEYFSEQPEEVAYRGERGAMFRRDWGALYQSLFPELELVDKRYEPLNEDGTGWDDVTFWVFEKPR